MYGLRGWVKVQSYTAPAENILRYDTWRLRSRQQTETWSAERLAEGRKHGKSIVARLASCSNRDEAMHWVGAEIAVQRSQFPPLPAGEYYYADLPGLTVVNLAGATLGTAESFLETGANDVLVVQGERERLIPLVPQVIREVDLTQGVLRVDWDAEF